MRKVTFYVEEREDGRPLGQLLGRRLPAVPRGRLQALIRKGEVKLGGKVERRGDAIARAGASVAARIPGNLGNSPLRFELDGRRVLGEGDGFAVLDKPDAVKMHRNHPGETTITLQEAAVEALGAGVQLVHRLDRGTSGVLVVATDPVVARHLGRQFARGTVEKRYLAMVEGVPAEDEGRVDLPLRRVKGRALEDRGRGKASVTRFRVLARGPRHALVEAWPETGRTHQIRAHLASLGHPLVGDLLYGGRLGIPGEKGARPLDLGGPLLHCASLEFATGQGGERARFEAPLPPRFKSALRHAGVKDGAGRPVRSRSEPEGPGSARGRRRRTPLRGRRVPPRRKR